MFLCISVSLRILRHLSETVYFQKRSISNQNQVFCCHHHRHEVSHENIASLIGCSRFKRLRIAPSCSLVSSRTRSQQFVSI
uniref:Putative secreted protein n=1 Tax=Ixodes ricinus TaxID=34613 RepID=A0A6B0U674_IXORI